MASPLRPSAPVRAKSLPLLLLAGWLGCTGAAPVLPDGGGTDAGTLADGGPDDGGGGGDGGNAGPDLLDPCPPGATRRPYSLSPIDPLPPLGALQLPNLIPGTILISAGVGGEHSVRLDLCEVNGELALHGVLFRGNSLEAVEWYRLDELVSAPQEQVIEIDQGFVREHRLPPSAFSVEGLADALQGNLQALRVRFITESGLVILGHDGFLAVARGRVGPNTIEYTNLAVVVGGLAEGDVFAGLPCGFEETLLTTSFTMATATVDVTACTFLGSGITTGYRITALAIQDSSPELSTAEQARFEYSSAPAVESVMNYVFNHHNACDSFDLVLDHAEYAASASPSAGCGATVPNAPERNFNEDPSSPVLFRIRYHGGPWMDGEIAGCHHYLFCP